MLVLGRHIRESITVILPDGRQGKIIVTDIKEKKGSHGGHYAKIGLEFPDDVRFVRSEILERTKTNEE